MQMVPWEEVGGLGASPQTPGGRPGLAVVVWVAGLALPSAHVGLSEQLSWGHTQE